MLGGLLGGGGGGKSTSATSESNSVFGDMGGGGQTPSWLFPLLGLGAFVFIVALILKASK